MNKTTILPGQVNFNYEASTALPLNNLLLAHSPAIFQGLRSNLKDALPVTEVKGAGVLQSMNPKQASPGLQGWFNKVFFEEFISVYLAADTAMPVLLLPVDVNVLTSLLTPDNYKIASGSIWIHSSLFDNSAPAGDYTGLTISGGTLSFTEKLGITNKTITIPANTGCNVLLNLQQPLDTTVSPDNLGIDAMNADVKLPTQFSFSFSGPLAEVTGIADASWNLYGSSNTFQYDASKKSPTTLF